MKCEQLMNLVIYKPWHTKLIKEQWTKCKYGTSEWGYVTNQISDDEYVMKKQSYERCLQSEGKVY